MAKKGFADWIFEWDIFTVEKAMAKATSDYDNFIKKGVMQPVGLQNWMNRLTGMYLYLKDNEEAVYAFRDQHINKCKLPLVDEDASKEFRAILDKMAEERKKAEEEKKKAEEMVKGFELGDSNKLGAIFEDMSDDKKVSKKSGKKDDKPSAMIERLKGRKVEVQEEC